MENTLVRVIEAHRETSFLAEAISRRSYHSRRGTSTSDAVAQHEVSHFSEFGDFTKHEADIHYEVQHNAAVRVHRQAVPRHRAEEDTRRAAQEAARRAAEREACWDAEEIARLEAAEDARWEAEEVAQREAAEVARREAEEVARQEAEEAALWGAEDDVCWAAIEAACQEAEEAHERDEELVLTEEERARFLRHDAAQDFNYVSETDGPDDPVNHQWYVVTTGKRTGIFKHW